MEDEISPVFYTNDYHNKIFGQSDCDKDHHSLSNAKLNNEKVSPVQSHDKKYSISSNSSPLTLTPPSSNKTNTSVPHSSTPTNNSSTPLLSNVGVIHLYSDLAAITSITRDSEIEEQNEEVCFDKSQRNFEKTAGFHDLIRRYQAMDIARLIRRSFIFKEKPSHSILEANSIAAITHPDDIVLMFKNSKMSDQLVDRLGRPRLIFEFVFLYEKARYHVAPFTAQEFRQFVDHARAIHAAIQSITLNAISASRVPNKTSDATAASSFSEGRAMISSSESSNLRIAYSKFKSQKNSSSLLSHSSNAVCGIELDAIGGKNSAPPLSFSNQHAATSTSRRTNTTTTLRGGAELQQSTTLSQSRTAGKTVRDDTKISEERANATNKMRIAETDFVSGDDTQRAPLSPTEITQSSQSPSLAALQTLNAAALQQQQQQQQHHQRGLSNSSGVSRRRLDSIDPTTGAAGGLSKQRRHRQSVTSLTEPLIDLDDDDDDEQQQQQLQPEDIERFL